MIRIASVFVFAAIAMASIQSQAQGFCDPERDPHSFGCHESAFTGREFGLERLDFRRLQGEWFATSFALPNGNFGSGFAMDLNPMNPRRPGLRGVMNVLPNGFTTVLGSMFVQGDRIQFPNWQNAPMISHPQSLAFPDRETAQFTTFDRFGIAHSFQCRLFLRHNKDHLTCAWSILQGQGPRAQWAFMGYFGFLTRADWDDFVRNGG